MHASNNQLPHSGSFAAFVRQWYNVLYQDMKVWLVLLSIHWSRRWDYGQG
ncbi:hypothetical protein ACRALDRAFT_2021139 [Sodiomyces alcalophilus JCM 7366]